MRRFILALSLATTCSTAALAATPATDDPLLWLEEVQGSRALSWVAEQDSQSTRELAGSDEFKTLSARFLAILDSDAKIPYVSKIGTHYYNFWRDKKHERGLWRRTTLDEYRKAEPVWETVLDLDSLSKVENMNWVWHGAQSLPPDYTRCLVNLSRGGADADVSREFDLTTRTFVRDGFSLPESKSNISWRDRDHVYVGLAIDSTTMTTSGYPRIVKEWTRGTPLSAATTVFEGKHGDVSVYAYRHLTPGFERDFVGRSPTFFTNELFLRRDGKMIRIDKPDDANASTFREWLLIRLRTDWTAGGKTWPAGALLATRLDDFLAGKRELEMLFTPEERKSLDGYSTTRNVILLNELDNVKNRLYALRWEGGRWTRTPLSGLPEFGAIKVSAVDDRESDDYWLTITDFLTPSSLAMGTVGGGPPERLKQSPSFFETAGLEVSQHEAVSKDGTRVPYFKVARKDLVADGTAPTLLYGYGGFELSELPYYSGVQGSGWLEKGGVLVVANIRGGGEFGPKWHQAALKANRPRAYEDFIAVGEDLVKRRVTSPKHLGILGGSNGGLLVGNAMVMRPDLFGAVVCQVPLLDMKRYNKLLAGASWMGEYGDPDKAEEWAFIRTYSPYHLVRKGAKYPRTLFTTSTRDDRVHPGHARKMVARMKEQGHDVLYYENVEGGHAGAANNKQRAFMSALAYTFLWKQLGVPAGSALKQ